MNTKKIMNEGLIIANEEGVIKYINNGALKLLGYEKDGLKDKSVSVLSSSILKDKWGDSLGVVGIFQKSNWSRKNYLNHMMSLKLKLQKEPAS